MKSKRFRYSFLEQLKLATVLVSVTVFFVISDWLWRWDQHFYDIQMRNWSQPAPDDVVIIAIDETSLIDIGRWPWSRKIHAELINHLAASDVKSIVFDVIFAEENQLDPAGDQALELAINNAGNVILPVLVEQPRLGAQLKETLPMPGLIEAGAKLGHVHIELDTDGIARSVYLYEGLGEAHWPHISLESLRLEGDIRSHNSREKKLGDQSSWVRDELRLIPFLGPPGHFHRISYKDVIQGKVSNDSLRGKTIFVGVTATGLGDALPSPVSGLSHPMPGIEINANIYQAVKDNRSIRLIDTDWRLIISAFIALMPVLLFPFIRPGVALFLTAGLIVITALLSFYLLTSKLIWFPPLAVIVSLLISYPIWSWRRLDFTVNYIDKQLALLNREPGIIPSREETDLKQVTSFFASVLPCNGWAVFKNNGTTELQYNWHAHSIPNSLPLGSWTKHENNYWLKTLIDDEPKTIALQFTSDSILSQVQLELMNNISHSLYPESTEEMLDTVERIERQILQVQNASARLRALREFIAESLEQMAEGVVILSPLGKVVLFNRKATELFKDLDLKKSTILDIINNCELEESVDWREMFIQVLHHNIPLQVQANTGIGNDLLLQFASLRDPTNSITGVIVNFSDITHIREIERKRVEFINFLSHDLRSPLSSALAIIQMNKTENAGLNEDSVNRLKQYTEKALKLTEGFVQLARADNLDSIHFSESNLSDIIYNAADQLWEKANHKNTQIHIDTNLPTTIVLADASLLERAIINLIGNAIKYSPTNSQITVYLTAEDNDYICSIKDNGPGISADEIPQLFNRFHRVQKSNNHLPEGIGLGLAFVKSVIEGHRGSVWVKSEPDKGSVFSFRLPKAK